MKYQQNNTGVPGKHGRGRHAQAVAALWLALAAGMPAGAQVSAEDMARMRELRPGEHIVQTREGCGLVASERRSPEVIAFYARSSWEGACADGLTLGPGKLITRHDNMETFATYEGWHYYGHSFGHTVSKSKYGTGKSETFEWDRRVEGASSAFAQQHAADVEAVKQAMEPTLAQLRREADLAQAQKQREAERQRLAVEAEQQRQRDEADRAEQRFRASLRTMNPGQLFAHADELNVQGDPARAREVRRALMSRFPDHPLAAAAARQTAAESGGDPAGGGGSSTGRAASDTGGSASVRPPSGFSKENSRYSSICMRNAAKAEQAITTAKARRYFGGAVDLEIFDMVKRIAQPCMAYDAKAKWAYDDAEQPRARLQAQCQSGSCSRWPEGETGQRTRQWFEIFSSEFKKMMADWEGYSSDLDLPGGGRPPEGTRSAGGRLSSQQCEAMRQTVVATRAPPNASVTAATETVMLLTKTSMDMIDGGCPGATPRDRHEHQQAYLAAERACNQVQSGGRRCVPQAHATSAVVNRPPVSSRGEPSSTVTINPLTGRCTPVCARECRSLAGGEELCRGSSGGGSGGGIRTAR